MWRVLGLLAFVYAAFVIFVAYKKPAAIWNMKKIATFKKVLGEKGTVIFFYIWAVVFIGLGIWAFM